MVNRGTLTRFVLLLAAFGLLAPAGSSNLSGQQKPDVSVQVKVVNVPATVRDKHGKIVTTLTKDDFVLEEDGRPQDIHYFSQENNLALTLGLLVDTSLSQRRVLGEERSASASFLDQMLRPEKDQAFLIHFDYEVELLQDLTSSREKLRDALNKLDEPHFTQTGSGNPPDQSGGIPPGGRRGGGSGGHRGGGTQLYDAVYLASEELMKKQTGRKAIVVLSDGVDHGSKESLRSAIETAQRTDTMVYSIYFPGQEPFSGFGGGYGGHHGGWGGPGGPGGHRGGYPQESHVDGKKILEQISRETGGRLFEVSGKQTVDKIYAQIQEELRNQYSLGYTPDHPDSGGGYHKIAVRTKQKELVVQAREGYYAGSGL